MYEKVSPEHPDKLCDRIAGALVDYAYTQEENPKIAVEVLLGHGKCLIISETSVVIPVAFVKDTVTRIAGKVDVEYLENKQDVFLADNQADGIRCGDNGIFTGAPITDEQRELTEIAYKLYERFHSDGKYIRVNDGVNDKLIICQSKAMVGELRNDYPDATINPLGYWTGGIDVDTGATNRKLGSDMGDGVTGGGMCLSGDSEFIGDDLKWHRIDQYNGGKIGQWNNGVLEFVNPIAYYVNENERMFHIYNDAKLSMCLTLNHEVALITSKGNFIKKPLFSIIDNIRSDYGSAGQIPHSFTYVNVCEKSKYKTDDEYRLQVAFCADGTILNNTKKWSGRIRVKKEYKKQRLRDILKNIDHVESFDGEYSIFWCNPVLINRSLYDCFHDENFDILYEELFKWDGDKSRNIFRTTKIEDANFAQFVLSSKGVTCGILSNDRVGEVKSNGYSINSVEYCVRQYKSSLSGLRRSKESNIKVDELPEQKSYCFTVPSHNLLIRHNGKIFVTGNCGKDLSKADVSVNIFAHIMAQQLGKPVKLSCAIGDKEVDGVPYSDIVQFAREYITAIGGFEKFAEWGLIRPEREDIRIETDEQMD